MKAHIFHVLETIHGQNHRRQSDIRMHSLQSQNTELEQTLKSKDAEIKSLQSRIEDLESQLREMMDTDNLTGLPNRESFKHHLLHSIKRALRLGYSLSIMILDIDQLENINQSYGREMGNKVITKVAKVLRSSVREVDMAARWDNDELIAILHETSTDAASLAAQRIYKKISTLDIVCPKSNKSVKVGVSIAVAGYLPHSGEATDLIAEVCEALAKVKQENIKRSAIA
jgi:two-component system cell cycle response regulator